VSPREGLDLVRQGKVKKKNRKKIAEGKEGYEMKDGEANVE
jgi:hypothetical protein